MSLRNINIKRSYETLDDRTLLVNNFYVPALKETVTYNRVAGFFSSSSLSIAAEGIASLIDNGGHMRLLISPELSDRDANAIINSKDLNTTLDVFEDVGSENWLKNDSVKALAWLLNEKRLEIKIVIDDEKRETLFHQKIGIMIDKEGNGISFSGSINESAKAWISNIEEFKVFKSWESGQNDYYSDDFNKFQRYWNYPNNNGSIKVFDVPAAIKNEILKIVPDDIYDLEIMKRYRKEKDRKKVLNLFDHQKDSVKSWIDNNYKLLNIMATGTGKTRTAIGCIYELLQQKIEFVAIVSTPENSLTNQWIADVKKLDIPVDKLVKIESGTSWKANLEKIMLDMQLHNYKSCILFTTHSLSSSEDFIRIIKNNKGKTNIFYICDECHAIGSPKQKIALIDEYDMRIGLSATPDRMFDDEGTSLIYKYFGSKTFEFGIYEALHTINPLTGAPYLNEFEYHPIFVELTPEEWNDYKKISNRIALISKKIEEGSDEYSDEDLANQRMARSRITKNAVNKYDSYHDLLISLRDKGIKDNIITFVSSYQIENAMQIAKDNKLYVAKVTENEDTKVLKDKELSERDEVIKNFRENKINVLFGISCLDQGIDIPNARIAILMSNSINPREYIQRVGRVIRYAKGKDTSHIYDMIAIPPLELRNSENGWINLVKREAKRTLEISCNAKNFNEVIMKYNELGVDINEHK